MPFVATINVPGYLPMDDEPPAFDHPSHAWQWLADERARDEDDAAEPGDDQYSSTFRELCDRAKSTETLIGEDGTGVIYGGTPGYDGEHDLGLAYCVMFVNALERVED